MVGAVLCGGASRRMGTPKALVEVDGVAMATRVATAMREAGATRVVLVGGEPAWSVLLDLPLVPDRWPGEGPLAGLATALSIEGPEEVVLVAACDQPWLDAGSLRRLVRALAADRTAVVAVAVGPDGRRTPFPAAWRASEAARLAERVEGGARRADAAVDGRPRVEVALGAAVLADVDRPSDLAPRPPDHP